MPSIVSWHKFIFSKTSTTLTLCILWWKPLLTSSFNTPSPQCPKGVCPKSWPSEIASTKSSFKFKALAIVLAIWATSSVWVNLVLKWSSNGAKKTWVLCFSRLKDFEWRILSLSLWKSVLILLLSGSGFLLPFEKRLFVAYSLSVSISLCSNLYFIVSMFCIVLLYLKYSCFYFSNLYISIY